jgi:hypothetical protein
MHTFIQRNLALCMEPHTGLFCARGNSLKDYKSGAERRLESADERSVGILGKELGQSPAPEFTPFSGMDRRTEA